MLSTPESVRTIGQSNRTCVDAPSQIWDRRWTRQELMAAAEMDRKVQRHPQHMLARLALANHGDSSCLERIRTSVARSLGGTAGTHYIVAALHLAHLALTFPQILSATQQAILTAPLEAAEMARDSTEEAAAGAQLAA
jgi:hypothetical protein